MAALIADLDGSTFKWGTNEFLPGAFEHLNAWQEAGHQIIFMTQRDEGWGKMIGDTKKLLAQHFPGSIVLFGVTSPRIVINDAGAAAINHKKNSPWNYDLASMV